MTGLQFRLLAIGLALLLSAPVAVEMPAEVQDDAFEDGPFAPGPGGIPARGPDADARLLGVDDSSDRGWFDPTFSSRTLSRPPPL